MVCDRWGIRTLCCLFGCKRLCCWLVLFNSHFHLTQNMDCLNEFDKIYLVLFVKLSQRLCYMFWRLCMSGAWSRLCVNRWSSWNACICFLMVVVVLEHNTYRLVNTCTVDTLDTCTCNDVLLAPPLSLFYHTGDDLMSLEISFLLSCCCHWWAQKKAWLWQKIWHGALLE